MTENHSGTFSLNPKYKRGCTDGHIEQFEFEDGILITYDKTSQQLAYRDIIEGGDDEVFVLRCKGDIQALPAHVRTNVISMKDLLF